MTDLHEPGAKDDNEKPRADLVLGDFRNALTEVAKVGTFGAKKYSEHGWLSVPDGYNRYSDAMIRHYLTEDAIDSESYLLHDAHLAWNALARLELRLRGVGGKTKRKLQPLSEKQQYENLLQHAISVGM